MITNALQEMERSVESANVQISNLSQKLVQVERTLPEDLEEQATVLELLDSVTEVKHDYENLRKDLKEVQQLQKEMTHTLRYQLRTMSQTFEILKKKIEANPAQYSNALQHHNHTNNQQSNSKIH
uniref:CSON010186 protein n=1 Tax=Culicoides sonorensis TaxID=179676 RepID=A0A336K2T5_CULSO